MEMKLLGCGFKTWILELETRVFRLGFALGFCLGCGLMFVFTFFVAGAEALAVGSGFAKYASMSVKIIY